LIVRVVHANLSFIIYKEWGKTTTKTEEVEPEAGIVPVAKRATGEPGIVVPSAPTNPLKFNFHFLTFLLLFTENGEKQQRKPRMKYRRPGAPLLRHAQRAYLASTLCQAPIRINFIIYPFF